MKVFFSFLQIITCMTYLNKMFNFKLGLVCLEANLISLLTSRNIIIAVKKEIE